MKKIFFVAIAATLLAAGCQKTEVINQYVGDSMTFSAGMGKLTKVDDPALTDTPELQQQGFKTWVYAAYADPVNGIAVGNVHDKMSGIDVTYKGGAWCTSEEYFGQQMKTIWTFLLFLQRDSGLLMPMTMVFQ